MHTITLTSEQLSAITMALVWMIRDELRQGDKGLYAATDIATLLIVRRALPFTQAKSDAELLAEYGIRTTQAQGAPE